MPPLRGTPARPRRVDDGGVVSRGQRGGEGGVVARGRRGGDGRELRHGDSVVGDRRGADDLRDGVGGPVGPASRGGGPDRHHATGDHDDRRGDHRQAAAQEDGGESTDATGPESPASGASASRRRARRVGGAAAESSPPGTTGRVRAAVASRSASARAARRGEVSGSWLVTLPFSRVHPERSTGWRRGRGRSPSPRMTRAQCCRFVEHVFDCSHEMAGTAAGGGGHRGTPGMERMDGLVRSVTTPEFAGMTFHEVLCKSALNRVPGVSAMPFDWTVNPYRGCSHACSYCLSPDTLILKADGRQVRCPRSASETRSSAPSWERDIATMSDKRFARSGPLANGSIASPSLMEPRSRAAQTTGS